MAVKLRKQLNERSLRKVFLVQRQYMKSDLLCQRNINCRKIRDVAPIKEKAIYHARYLHKKRTQLLIIGTNGSTEQLVLVIKLCGAILIIDRHFWKWSLCCEKSAVLRLPAIFKATQSYGMSFPSEEGELFSRVGRLVWILYYLSIWYYKSIKRSSGRRTYGLPPPWGRGIGNGGLPPP